VLDAATGRARWTLALLADAVVALTPHARVSRHTIGRRLAENDLKPWQQKMWCVPRIDAEYVARMEDVLDLYRHPPAAGTLHTYAGRVLRGVRAG
jgi:hypothetical protein